MSDMRRTLLQPAFILNRRPYRESSLLLKVFSPEYGKVALVAKGGRNPNSQFGSVLQLFSALNLSWVGRSDLCTLTAAEIASPATALDATSLYCGLYLNELVDRFVASQDPHPRIFTAYADCLEHLQSGAAVETALRLFECTLLDESGYGLQLQYEVEYGEPIKPDVHYRYIPEQGPVIARESRDAVQGETLIGLRESRLEGAGMLKDAKRLMRRIIDHHLAGKPLKSRALFKRKTV